MLGRILLIFFLSLIFQFGLQALTGTQNNDVAQKTDFIEGHRPFIEDGEGVVDPELLDLGQRATPEVMETMAAKSETGVSSVRVQYCIG